MRPRAPESETPRLAFRAVMAAGDAARALRDRRLSDRRLTSVLLGAHAAILEDAPPMASGGGLFRRKARLGKALVAHQRLLEILLDAGDVLAAEGEPRLTPAEARGMLAGAAETLATARARFADTVQYQVRVACPALEPAGGVRDPGASDPALARALAPRIAEVAADSIALPREGPEVALNHAVLIRRREVGRLEALLEAIDREHRGALSIRMVGPNAPLSFAALAVERPDPAALATARVRLGLAPSDRRTDPARAFRRAVFAAAECGGPRDMDALCRARDLLRRDREARAALAAEGLPVPEHLALVSLTRDPAASEPVHAGAARTAA